MKNAAEGSEVLLRDIISSVPPVNNSVVRKMVLHLKRGKPLPPLQVEAERREHWVKWPDGELRREFGHKLVHGRHRLTAFRIVYGDNYIAKVLKLQPDSKPVSH